MEFYVTKLALRRASESNKEVDEVEVDIYKADRQEYNQTHDLLIFKNNKECYSLPIDYQNIVALDDTVLRKTKQNTYISYVATSRDTPNKALAKIQTHLLREYGNTHPIAYAIPKALRNMRQPLSAIMRGKDTAEIMFTEYLNQENKCVWYIRNYNQTFRFN